MALSVEKNIFLFKEEIIAEKMSPYTFADPHPPCL